MYHVGWPIAILASAVISLVATHFANLAWYEWSNFIAPGFVMLFWIGFWLGFGSVKLSWGTEGIAYRNLLGKRIVRFADIKSAEVKIENVRMRHGMQQKIPYLVVCDKQDREVMKLDLRVCSEPDLRMFVQALELNVKQLKISMDAFTDLKRISQ